MNKKSVLLTAMLWLLYVPLLAAKVDTVAVHSQRMNKYVKAAIILPDSYDGKKPMPVVYLLHGFSDTFRAWLTLPTVKGLTAKLADQYGFIIVCPDGAYGSWYLDSPINKEFQYETFLTKELVSFVDDKYKTINRREGRFISGLSMGGHGALYLAARNPQLYAGAGSIAGAVDISSDIAARGDIRPWFVKLLGEPEKYPERYREYSVLHNAALFKEAGLKLMIDCGTGDFLFENNKALHAKLLELGVPHDYTERPGQHNWAYFGNSLEYHLVFFKKTIAQLP